MAKFFASKILHKIETFGNKIYSKIAIYNSWVHRNDRGQSGKDIEK